MWCECAVAASRLYKYKQVFYFANWVNLIENANTKIYGEQLKEKNCLFVFAQKIQFKHVNAEFIMNDVAD